MNPFSLVLGQEQAVQLLTQAIARGRVAPAYLFAGPDGVGRSLAARCFAEALFCRDSVPLSFPTRGAAILRHRIDQRNHPDLLWVEPTYLHQGQRVTASEAAKQDLKRKAPPQIRLDQIREIAQFLSRSPLEAPRMVVVIEQAESMAEAAANGLLKTLEEPGQATLILLAPNGDSLLPTLVSRCQRIPFRRLSPAVMGQILHPLEPDILNHPELLAIAQGSPGAALSHWHHLQAIPPDLRQALTQPLHNLQEALTLAREVDQTLDLETQLWLIDYLQYWYWNRYWDSSPGHSPYSGEPACVSQLRILERTQRCLLSYVQPRLVWEVTLMSLLSG